MQIQHTSRHEVHATEAVKQHIEDKLQRCLGVFRDWRMCMLF